MSDQDARAMNRLSDADKVAEGASKRRDYNFRPRKTPAQIAKEGFPRFQKLPAEIRSKIWQDAMPPYGFYTALMLGREEPMPQQPPSPAPMAFRVVYRLEPVPRDQQDDELRTRLDTMRAIQGVCSEAAHEVQRAFPTTIDCTGGKLRFNAVHDRLNLSDLQCPLGSGFIDRFARYAQGGVVFANDWHKIPHTMLFNNKTLWVEFFRAARGPSPAFLRVILQRMKGFLDFLADCTNLRTLGMIYDVPVVSFFHLIDYTSSEVLPFSLLGPTMRGLFYQRLWHASYASTVREFMTGVEGVKVFTNGLDPAQGDTAYLQPIAFHHPRLQDLQVLTVVPVSPVLRDEVMMYKGDSDL